MSDVEDDHLQDERPAKRFKHQSYKETLKEVHVTPAFAQAQFDNEIGDNDSHFHEALGHWRELNLAPAFITFANKTDGLSASMPLLVHHWKEIVELWLAAVDGANDEGLKALLDLFQKLTHDLRTTIAPLRTDVLSRMLKLLPRSLLAETLTVLLETFSCFFKYVLIPLDVMSDAWLAFADVLPKCNPEVQRVVAELWGTALRRMKTVSREACVAAIVESASADVSAWVFVSACKSVSQTLHTIAPTVFTPLIRSYMLSEDPEPSFTVLRRLITALVHHCKSADQFAPLSDILVQMLEEAARDDLNAMQRLLEVTTVACSVRQGSRLTAAHIRTLLSQFITFPLTEQLHPSLLKLAASCLIAGDMAMWTGPGRKVLEYVWDGRPTLAMDLTGALAELKWGGWKLLALPHLLKKTQASLEAHSHKTLELLSALHRDGRLSSVDATWKQSLQTWVDSRFDDWAGTEEQMLELQHVIQLSDLLPNLSPLILRALRSALESVEPRQDYLDHETNSSWLIGSCISCLAGRKRDERPSSDELALWMDTVIKRWSWSGYVLESLFSLMSVHGSIDDKMPFDHIYQQLKPSLLSHSRRLRLSALRLLSSQLADGTGSAEVVKRCLLGEEVTPDVHGVRERVLRITRMNQILRDDDAVGADIAGRWLIAQLKVNLRPLWKPAAEALAEMSSRFGELLWQLLYSELQLASSGEAETRPIWMKEEDEDLDTIHEEERTWRDPSAHKLRVSVFRWLRGNMARIEIIQAQLIHERFDAGSHEVQLLVALTSCPAIAEKHSRDLVPHFFSLAPPESPTKLARTRLSAWLTLFSKFVNPKALRATEDLQSTYMILLSHPDRALQRLALSCLLTYKAPALVSKQDSLNALLDEARWRDELTQFDMAGLPAEERKDVVGVATRLLFGIMLERHGRARGVDRRAAVLTALGGCTDEELSLLADLMLRPINRERDLVCTVPYSVHPIPDSVTERQLSGFLALLGDVLRNLGTRLVQRWPDLLSTLLDVTSHAQGQIEAKTGEDRADEDLAEEVADPESEDMEESRGSHRAIRTVRQLGLKRLADFFRAPVTFDFGPYMEEAFRAFITPRIAALDSENTQSPTALLELFHVWSMQASYARYLVEYDDRTLPRIYGCLVATNVKPPVISKVFDIVESLLGISSTDEAFSDAVFKPHVALLLNNLGVLLSRNKTTAAFTDQLGRREISILSQLAPFMTDSAQASLLLNLFLPILRKPSNLIPEKIKVDILSIIRSLLLLIFDLRDSTSSTNTRLHSLLAYLFQNLRSRQARLALVSTFNSFSEIDQSLSQVAKLLESLNAYSVKRLEEPDFDRRLTAFASLNENLYKSLTPREWLPILYNALNFIQDPEELTVRSNASSCMKRYIDIVAESGTDYEAIFLKALWPGLRNGLHSKSEPVRVEILGTISYAVTKCDRVKALREMQPLLAAGDEEANFFNNILHVQVHRRTRALRRLADICAEGQLSSGTISEVFVPLIGSFIIGNTSVDHLVVNEAITTTGKISRRLQWRAYYGLVQQYLRLSRNKDASERLYIRTVVALLDNFHFPMTQVVEVGEHDDEVKDSAEIDDVSAQEARRTAQVSEAVNQKLLPALLQHLEKREETDDSLRIPIAIGIVQVALHLPPSSREMQISRLLTTLSQVFRSKSNDTRDLARGTLCKIAVILGPAYLHVIIRELRGALLRGPHLHVLAYVTHALLVHVTSEAHASTFAQLDECVADVAHIASEVVFGESGKDLQSEDFKTKMKEVRSSTAKGLDSFAIIAKHITPPKISNLLLPLRNILQQTETLKVMQQVEDVLRRIGNGLNANQYLVPKELLVLCHTLISQNARFLKDVPKVKQANGKGKRHSIVELKRNLVQQVDHYANNSFRFIVFGLELFNTAHRRSRFDFQDPAVIARLEPMVSVIGNTLYSSHSQVVVPGLKAAAAILRCPLKSITKSLPVFVRQIIEIVKQTGSTESDVVQTAFRSLSAILRDQPNAQVKEADLIFLLELLSPDLEEPARQASVFAMLRAIVARKFVVPEIYDLMEKVAEIMVTNQSTQVQELSRGVLLQFLLEYPQGKGRLRNQMTFLAKNLSYVHESGRRSVLELLNAILVKFNPDLIREYSDLLFVALVMVIANDDSSKCREMASELIKGLFGRLEDAQRRVVMTHVHSWAALQGQPQLARVSSQVYSIIIDHLERDVSAYSTAILEDLNAILSNSSQQLDIAEESSEEIDVEWQVPYHALIALSKLLRACPEVTTEDKVTWPSIVSLLLFPHSWVRTATCRLLGLLFAAVPAVAPKSTLPDNSPFSIMGMEDVANKLCLQLRSANLDAALSLQIVKNLFYIGKSFSMLTASYVPQGDGSEDSEDASDSEDEDEDEDDVERDSDMRKRDHLSWLFSKLSFQARRAHINRRNKSSSPENWYHQPASVLRWFAAMTAFLEAPVVERYLIHVLSPVYRVVEEDTIRDSHLDELKTLAIELQELLQAKVGTTKFSEVYSRIKQKVLSVRRERKTARAVQTTTNPEAAAKRKLQRNTAKKDSRKRKNTAFAEARGRIKRRKNE